MANIPQYIILAIFVAVIIWAIKRSSLSFGELNKSIKELNREIADIRLQISEHYVRREETEVLRVENKEGHENFWKELSAVRERITSLEARGK